MTCARNNLLSDFLVELEVVLVQVLLEVRTHLQWRLVLDALQHLDVLEEEEASSLKLSQFEHLQQLLE